MFRQAFNRNFYVFMPRTKQRVLNFLPSQCLTSLSHQVLHSHTHSWQSTLQ